MTLKDIHIGTSGWSYKHWQDVFYPADINTTMYLEYYTKFFRCVELNSSFYNLPRKTTVTGWLNRTPPEFRFCTKISRLITHQLQLVNSEEAVWKYFNIFEELNPKMGPVLIQLHPGMQYDKSLIYNFLNLLKEKYSQYRFAFEVRNNSWINDDFFDLLSQSGMAFVIADSGRRYPYCEVVTTDFVYIRFHGREQLYATDYSETDLQLYGDKIMTWANEGKKLWVFFNNDYQGFAVKNAARLIEIIEKKFIDF